MEIRYFEDSDTLDLAFKELGPVARAVDGPNEDILLDFDEMRVALVCCFIGLIAASPLSAQPLTDTLITWRGYARTAQTQVHLYPGPPDAETRTRTIVVKELATNRGPSTLSDVRYLAEHIGRQFGIDPAQATWIFHWGAFSFDGADPSSDKELFLRATFHRTSTNRLSTPYWKVVDRNAVRELTDRRFR